MTDSSYSPQNTALNFIKKQPWSFPVVLVEGYNTQSYPELNVEDRYTKLINTLSDLLGDQNLSQVIFQYWIPKPVVITMLSSFITFDSMVFTYGSEFTDDKFVCTKNSTKESIWKSENVELHSQSQMLQLVRPINTIRVIDTEYIPIRSPGHMVTIPVLLKVIMHDLEIVFEQYIRTYPNPRKCSRYYGQNDYIEIIQDRITGPKPVCYLRYSLPCKSIYQHDTSGFIRGLTVPLLEYTTEEIAQVSKITKIIPIVQLIGETLTLTNVICKFESRKEYNSWIPRDSSGRLGAPMMVKLDPEHRSKIVNWAVFKVPHETMLTAMYHIRNATVSDFLHMSRTEFTLGITHEGRVLENNEILDIDSCTTANGYKLAVLYKSFLVVWESHNETVKVIKCPMSTCVTFMNEHEVAILSGPMIVRKYI